MTKDRAPSRSPPTDVTDVLRREVSFRCPVGLCGSPFLSFHHFDPPWKEERHHRPEGMIAMCSSHCAEADGGHFTKAQLRQLKSQEHPNLFQSPLPWQPEALTFLLGNRVMIGPAVRFCIWEEPLLSVVPIVNPDGTYRLSVSANFRSREGALLLRIVDNQLHFDLDDRTRLRAATRAGSLRLAHESGTKLELEIEYLSRANFKARLKHQAKLKEDSLKSALRSADLLAVDSEGRYPMVTITGDFFGELAGASVSIEARKSSFNAIIPGFIHSKPGKVGALILGKMTIKPFITHPVALEFSGVFDFIRRTGAGGSA